MAWAVRLYPKAQAAYRSGEFVCEICDGGPANGCGCTCRTGPTIDANWRLWQAELGQPLKRGGRA